MDEKQFQQKNNFTNQNRPKIKNVDTSKSWPVYALVGLILFAFLVLGGSAYFIMKKSIENKSYTVPSSKMPNADASLKQFNKTTNYSTIQKKVCNESKYFVKKHYNYPFYPILRDCGNTFAVSLGTGYVGETYIFNDEGKLIATQYSSDDLDSPENRCEGPGCGVYSYNCGEEDICENIELECSFIDDEETCGYINALRFSRLNINICSKLKTLDSRADCFNELALIKKDDSICLKIEPYIDSWGELYYGGRESCISNLAYEISREAKSIEDCSILSKEAKDKCIRSYAISNKDKQIETCNSISDAELQEECLPVVIKTEKLEYSLDEEITISIKNHKKNTKIALLPHPYKDYHFEFIKCGETSCGRRGEISYTYDEIQKLESYIFLEPDGVYTRKISIGDNISELGEYILQTTWWLENELNNVKKYGNSRGTSYGIRSESFLVK